MAIFQMKTESKKSIKDHLKNWFSLVLQVPVSAWRLFRTHPIFTFILTSKWAFRAIVVLGPILFGLSLMLPTTQYIQGYEVIAPLWTVLLKVLPSIALFLVKVTAILGIASVSYLTLSDNWDVFIHWWFMGLARRRDRSASLTTEPLIIRERLSQFNATDGIFISMSETSRMLGFKPRKLTYVDDRHVTLIGGTRAGKGTSFIIPNLLHHKGSVIVYDPAGENFELTAAYRQQVLGQKVIALDPFGVTGMPSHIRNPLLDIDFEGDPLALDKCYMLAESLIQVTGSQPFFPESAQEMLAMTCAYIGLRSIPENMHLPQVYDLLHGSDLTPLWVAMGNVDGLGGVVSRYGQANAGREIKEFSNVLQSLRTALRFMATKSMRTSLSQSNVSLKSLKDGNTSIYIIMPAGAGATYKGWLRLLFNCAFDAMQDMSIPTPKTPTLFLMDEFPLLGHMERIKRAAGEAAKFGVKLFICAQDITQLKEIYGEAWETFIGNSGITIMFGNNDLATQKYLSDKLGKEYYTKVSRTTGKDGGSTSSSLELRDVARSDEVARNSGRETGTAYILIPDMKPMHLPRSSYYQWDMIPKGLVYKPDIGLTSKDVTQSLNTIAAE